MDEKNKLSDEHFEFLMDVFQRKIDRLTQPFDPKAMHQHLLEQIALDKAMEEQAKTEAITPNLDNWDPSRLEELLK